MTQLPDAERERRTLELVLQLAHSFHFLGRFQEMLEILAQQQERLEQLHEPILTGPYAFWRSHALSYLGEYEQSVHWAQRAIEMAQQCGDEATMGKAYYVLVRNSFWTCQFPQGIEYGHRAVTLLERAGELWWVGQTHWAVGINYTFMGELMSAWEPIARTQAIGDLLGIRVSSAMQRGAKATPRRLPATGRRGSPRVRRVWRAHLIRSIPPWPWGSWGGVSGQRRPHRSAALARTSGPVDESVSLPPAAELVSSVARRSPSPARSPAQARELASQALTISQAIKFPLGVGLAQHALARIVQSEGSFVDAERYLTRGPADLCRHPEPLLGGTYPFGPGHACPCPG